MRIKGSAQRLTIYVGESDRWDGQPAWHAILQLLRKQGMAGATVLRGLAGFGAHSHIHTATLVRLSQDLPMRIEVVDMEERIEEVLPALNSMVIDLLRAMLGKDITTHEPPSNVEAAQVAGHVMSSEVPTVHAEDSIGEVADHLTAADTRRVVVIDHLSHPIGIISDGDLIRWTEAQREPGLVESVLRRLRHDREMQQRLADAGTAADLMSEVPAPLHTDTPLNEILTRMVNEQHKHLLVVDDDGRLLGLVDRQRLLRTMLGQPN